MDNPKYANYDLGGNGTPTDETYTDEEDNVLNQCIPIPLKDLDMKIGPREWIYGTSLVRAMVTVFGGIGGVGKSSYVMKVLTVHSNGKTIAGIRAR